MRPPSLSSRRTASTVRENGFYRPLLRGEGIYNNLEMEPSPLNMKKTDMWQCDIPLFYKNSNLAKHTFQHISYSHMFIFIGEVALIPSYVNRPYSNCSIFTVEQNCWRETVLGK